jgi:hypothetical protein
MTEKELLTLFAKLLAFIIPNSVSHIRFVCPDGIKSRFGPRP